MDSVEMAMSPGAYLARHMNRNWPRYRHVLAALALSGDPARALMIAETGSTLEAARDGLLPGLLDIAKWVGLGAVIGGGIGALGGHADEITVPGGALADADVGLWIANSLGMAGLLVGIAQNLGQFVVRATDAAEIACYADDDRRIPLLKIDCLVQQYNRSPKLFVWTATADSVRTYNDQCLWIALNAIGK